MIQNLFIRIPAMVIRIPLIPLIGIVLPAMTAVMLTMALPEPAGYASVELEPTEGVYIVHSDIVGNAGDDLWPRSHRLPGVDGMDLFGDPDGDGIEAWRELMAAGPWDDVTTWDQTVDSTWSPWTDTAEIRTRAEIVGTRDVHPACAGEPSCEVVNWIISSLDGRR